MTTRSKLIVGALALVFLAASVDQALAGPIGDTGKLWQTRQDHYYDTSYGGGEITVFGYTGLNNAGYTAASSDIGTPDPSFQTFCLEAGEYTTNPLYFVIGSAAVKGGTGSSDPLSQGTAWLYSQFVAGTLSGYDYDASAVARLASARQLQEAIWYLEGESGGVNNAFVFAATPHGGAADASAGYLGVYALNNYFEEGHTTLKQDFLYYSVPDGGTTLMLLGGALMGLGALRRKFDA